MNFLFLVPKAVYDTKMSRVRFEEVAALTRGDYEHHHTVHTSGPGWPDWPDGLTARDYVVSRVEHFKNDRLRQPHMVLTYEITGLHKSPIPVAIIFHETYNRVKTMTAIREAGATLVIFTYANDLAQYQEELTAEGRMLTSIPHGADPTIYCDYGMKKDIDVLIVGNLARDFYPFRARLARLAQREIAKRGYRVFEARHPGFNLPSRDGTFVGSEYARLLNRSKLVVTCTGKHHYAFCKLVEIPLCWSLPVSDLPAERRGFFQKTMLNVEMWHTDREILYQIEAVLDDEALLTQMTTLAHDKVAQRLTMPHWAERFLFWSRRHVWGESPEPPMPPVGDDDA